MGKRAQLDDAAFSIVEHGFPHFRERIDEVPPIVDLYKAHVEDLARGENTVKRETDLLFSNLVSLI